METFGTRERPRLLVVGALPGDTAERFAALVPTLHMVASDEELQDVRQRDYDAAVLFDCDANLEEHLFVLQFGGYHADIFLFQRECSGPISRAGETVATEFSIPDGVPPNVVRLVRHELVPLVLQQQRQATLSFTVQTVYNGQARRRGISEALDSFLEDPDRKPLAGRFVRRYGGAEWWCLPAFTANPER